MLGLALSGGAARGAWQAGKAASLARPWDVVAGVSVGAVNAAHLAQYPVGEEAQAFEDLRKLWHTLKTSDVHKRWCPFGMIHSLWRKGVRDLRPLRSFLRKHLEPWRVRDSGRKLIVGAVTYSSRQWVEWTELDHVVLIDAVLASCAIPYAFEPQEVPQLVSPTETAPGPLYFDGGVQTVAPVEPLIRAGCTEVDAVVCFPFDPPVAAPASNALEAGLAAVDTMSYQILADDLRCNYAGVRDDAAVVIYRPDRDLGDGLDFSPQTNAWRWQLGETGAA